MPDQVAFPTENAYREQQSDYWSAQQSELCPSCRITPKDATQVSKILEIIVSSNVSFAIKSGGHSAVTAASNIDLPFENNPEHEEKITIDLSAMNFVNLSNNHDIVWLGPGARWGEVYHTLEEFDLAVPGGRVADVGVGGYILGGGMSWFANQVGWACDNVIEYEMVSANGTILYASEDENEDMFWALRGGMSAFGVITSFKMPTRRGSQVWGGSLGYDESQTETLLQALEQQNLDTFADSSATGYLSFGWDPKVSRMFTAAYVIENEGRCSGRGLDRWTDIPHMYGHLMPLNMSDSAKQLLYGNDRGFRHV
ncbi:hypothetical protein MBLNU459_g0390t2 [Dothideomycetes sp. NU459]